MKSTNKIYVVFITLILILLFNFPFIGIANNLEIFRGIPALYLYIFINWLLSIVLLYFLSKQLFKLPKKDE